jgi:hypothetical protein
MESATIDPKEFVRLNDCDMSYAAAKQAIREISARGKFVDDEHMKFTRACCLLVRERAKKRNDKTITTLLEQIVAPDNIDKHIYRVKQDPLDSTASVIARAGMASAVITTKGNPEEAGIETISLDAYEDSKLASGLQEQDQHDHKVFGKLTVAEQQLKLRKILRYSNGLLEYFDYLPKTIGQHNNKTYVQTQLTHGLKFLCRECLCANKSQQKLRIVVYGVWDPRNMERHKKEFRRLVEDATSLALSAKEWEGNVELFFGLLPQERGGESMHKRYIRTAKRAYGIEKNIGAFHHAGLRISDYEHTDEPTEIDGPSHAHENECRDIALKVEKVVSCEGLIKCPKELAAIRCGAKP